MRKIFLDIEAGEGTSVRYFQRLNKGFEIFSFEPDKRNIHTIQSRGLKTNLIPAAAWITDGEKRFYPGKEVISGTFYENKKTGGVNKDKFYMVKTVELAGFIRKNFIKEDYIVLKLNCEGAEYDLIPHLKTEGLIPWINTWYVDWHWKKIRMSEERHNEIMRMIPKHKPWRPC
jgi:FkbM family methyltransferase